MNTQPHGFPLAAPRSDAGSRVRSPALTPEEVEFAREYERSAIADSAPDVTMQHDGSERYGHVGTDQHHPDQRSRPT